MKKITIWSLAALAVLFAGWRLALFCLSRSAQNTGDENFAMIVEPFDTGDRLLIGSIQPEGPRMETIYFLSPEEGVVRQEKVEIEWEKKLLEELFFCWRERSGIPEEVTLNSCEVVYGYETQTEMGSSTIVGFVSTPPTITLDISEEITQYAKLEGLVLDSLVQTILEAYGEEHTLTILVEGAVVYGGEDTP